MSPNLQYWQLAKFVPYFRNPRKNDHAVDRMICSLREFGFKNTRLSSQQRGGRGWSSAIESRAKARPAGLPVILCDEWTDAQVKAFRLLVNRSANWADWDEDLLAVELQELKALDFDLDLTGFDPIEIDQFLSDEPAEEEDLPPLPTEGTTRLGDVWLCMRRISPRTSMATFGRPRTERERQRQ